MPTNIFYYNYYKPYILKENNNIKSTRRSSAKKEIAQSKKAKSGDNSYSYFLNKSIKRDLVSYATEISKNLNSIKDTSKYMVNRYSKNDLAKSDELNNFADGLEDFVNEINGFEVFYDKTSKESSALNGYKSILDTRIDENRQALYNIGVTKSKDDVLSFDREKFYSINKNNYIDNIFECAEMFDDIYNDTCEVMRLPMTEHMNFKNLDYYYNYAYESKNKYSFKFIETGFMVDIKL